MTSDTVIEIAGEKLHLLPERAVYWERASTLFVADPHFGKASSFRAAGVLVPRGTTTETLARLDVALRRTGGERVVFLGDFLHAHEGRSPEMFRAINDWRAARASIDMMLVRGNHDVRAGDPPRELDLLCVNGPMIEPPFVFAHHPRRSDDGYVLAGHVHPGVRLSGAAREYTRLPCFWFGSEVAVLPAFGEFTGLADVSPAPGDGVWVVADEEVIRVATAND